MTYEPASINPFSTAATFKVQYHLGVIEFGHLLPWYVQG